MSVTVTIKEQGCEPKEVQVLRVPCAHEWIDVAGTHYHVTSVGHVAGESPGAFVVVMRAREA